MESNQEIPIGDQKIDQGQLQSEIQRSEGPEETQEYKSPEDLIGDTGIDNRKISLEIREEDKKTQKGKEKPSWVRKFQDFIDSD